MQGARTGDGGEKRDWGIRRLPRVLAALAAAMIASFSANAEAAMIEAQTASLPTADAAALADLSDAGTLRPYSACSNAGGAGHPAVDRPLCGAALAPPVREFRVDRADAFLSLGLAGDGTGGQAFGEVRSMLGFRHLMDGGALAGWKVGADVQLGRTAFGTLDTPLDEQMHVSLGRDVAGWAFGFNAGATRLDAADPALATQTMTFAAGLARGFAGGAPGESHRLSLRLEEDSTAAGTWGWDQRTTLASLGYDYKRDIGSIGAEVSLSRADSAGVDAQSSARSEIKFRRPF